MEDMKLLKFITCGSVDDGKSTLIGHMLYDAKLLFSDQEKALKLESKVGSADGKIDYSLLLDGLMAEREQGITIDVAYRYFSTEKRSFIVADTPGHEEYTRNMAVGASFAELAIILVDASKGVLIQTKRHTRICSMMGIRHFVFAINKMDLVGYDEDVFKNICKQINELTAEYNTSTQMIIPVSATVGDNITTKSSNTKWFDGPYLLDYLENIDTKSEVKEKGFVLPIQRVSRPTYDFRGFQGEISVGSVKCGDEIEVLPSGEKAKIKSIICGCDYVNSAGKGSAVNISLDKEIDVSRGCVIHNKSSAKVVRGFEADMLWMDEEELSLGKNYLLKIGTLSIPATIRRISYGINVNTGEHENIETMEKNAIARCEIIAGGDIVTDLFENNKELGSFILVDRISNMTSSCGVVKRLISDDNVFWQNMDITREYRQNQLGQKAITIWFTGLSGAGKSTIANALEKRLVAMGKHTMLLDGDNVRYALNSDLGFSKEDRGENIRRVAEVAKLMNDAGLITLVSFITPLEEERQNARNIVGEAMIQVYTSTSLEECERRDVKGLYKKARQGLIKEFTGISSTYETPKNSEIEIDTEKLTVDQCVDTIIEYITNI